MLFDALTYFGPAGVAMNNGLVGQIPAFRNALIDAAREGNLDGDDAPAPVSDPAQRSSEVIFSGPESRFLESFPGDPVLSEHMLSLIKSAGMTVGVVGRQDPQATVDEFLRLAPWVRNSTLHKLGMGMMEDNVYLPWVVLAKDGVSMVLFPLLPAHPELNPNADRVFDAFADVINKQRAPFEFQLLLNGECYATAADWIESAEIHPVGWLTPFSEQWEAFDPASATGEHREIAGAIMNTINPIWETDESEDLKQWIPKIVELCRQMTAEDFRMLVFVRGLFDMANRADLADWTKDSSRPLGELGWSQLGDALKTAYPRVDLAKEA